jgi:hypothetical protein
MNKNAPAISHAVEKSVAEELARLLADSEWHGFEKLYSDVAETLCSSENSEPCRELLRLHVYGRLKNWVQHGALQQRGDEYHACGVTLNELKEHAVAEHCRELIETVLAKGRAKADARH